MLQPEDAYSLELDPVPG